MKKDWSIGLMTGTVNDGNIDIAALRTDGEEIFEFGPYELVPYQNKNIRHIIFETYDEAKNWGFIGKEPKIFSKLENLITVEQSNAVNTFLEKHNISKNKILSVGFHGQTVLHHPPKNKKLKGMTRQLGDGKLMSKLLNLPVVYDFRTNDVAHGGQGAPLAPIYHSALSKKINKYPTVFLNIGGVANITYIGNKDTLIAFDTGPGNAPIDDFVKIKKSGEMDRNGNFAKLGKVNTKLVKEFMMNNYFDKPYPKSLDRNDFNFEKFNNLELEDGCASLTKIIASTISRALKLLPQKPLQIIVSGGGRNNPIIMNEIKNETQTECIKVEDIGFRGDAIEAEAFAFLAVRSLKNYPLSYPLTTGISNPITGGKIVFPN